MSKTIELGTFEAAKAFDVSPVTLLTLIAQGRLSARKNESGRWQISRKSLEVWNAKRLARRNGNHERVGVCRGVWMIGIQKRERPGQQQPKRRKISLASLGGGELLGA